MKREEGSGGGGEEMRGEERTGEGTGSDKERYNITPYNIPTWEPTRASTELIKGLTLPFKGFEVLLQLNRYGQYDTYGESQHTERHDPELPHDELSSIPDER